MRFAVVKIKAKVLISLAVVAVSGCASTPNIMTAYDKTADFSSYSTYNFMPGAGPDRGEYRSLFTQYAMDAIDVEMQSRGYTKADDPDLWVNFNAVLQDKTKVTTSPSMPPPGYHSYYGYRGGYYNTWGAYPYGTETHVSQYTEGTFNIDLVDNAKDQLVWEAVGIGRVTEKKRKNLEETVKTGVANYFALYPYVAGGSSASE